MMSWQNYVEMKSKSGLIGQRLNIYRKEEIIPNTFISLQMVNIGKRKYTNWSKRKVLLWERKI
jgi:hypothetical protein